jgi:hypothetical protein
MPYTQKLEIETLEAKNIPTAKTPQHPIKT